MTHVEHYTQVTEVRYQTIESNLSWDIKNPYEIVPFMTSDTIKIPVVNAEW